MALLAIYQLAMGKSTCMHESLIYVTTLLSLLDQKYAWMCTNMIYLKMRHYRLTLNPVRPTSASQTPPKGPPDAPPNFGVSSK